MSWEGFTTQLGEVKDAYLDPLFDKPDSGKEILQKIKDKELGIEWWEEETRKLNALKDLIPEKRQQQVASILSQAGDSFNKAWKGAETVENWTDPGDVIAAGAAHTINFANSGIGLFTDGLTAVAHHGLRLHKPVARLTGTAASMYLTPRLLAGTGRVINRQIAISKLPASERVVNVKATLGNQIPSAGRTSASVLGKNSMFRTGSKAESRAIQLRQEIQAVDDAIAGRINTDKPYALLSVRPAADAGAIGDLLQVQPSKTAIHSIGKDQTTLKQQIGDWLVSQKKNFNIKRDLNKEFGFINDVSKGYQLRIKTTGAAKYLTDIKDTDEAVRKAAIKHIKLEKVTEKNTNRAETQDIGKIDVVTENLDRMNAAWDGTRGIDPEVLNPKILRKVVNQGARLKDKITSELSKRFGISLQKEHAFGIRSKEGFGQDAAVAQHVGETGMNNLLSKLTLNNAFSREAGYELGMPTHGYSQEELANMHPRRRAELENLGALEVLTHYGMMSNDPDAFKAEIDSLKDQLKGIKEGDPNIVPTSPGRIVTDADLLKIQQLGHKKGMDRTAAAEMVLAQREALNQLLDAGLEVGPKELKVLKEILTEIEIDTKIRRAKKDTKWKERFPGKSIDEYGEGNINVLPSAATGKPVTQQSLRLLQEKFNR